MTQYEKRITISESNTELVIEKLDELRGRVSRSEAIKRILSYLLNQPEACKGILETYPIISSQIPAQSDPNTTITV